MTQTKLIQAINLHTSKGATLVIALIILLVLLVLGVASMHSTVFEARISSNLRDTSLAFQAAESALKEGETWLNNLATRPPPVASCASQPCVLTLNQSRNPEGQNQTWWNSNSAAYSTTTLSGISSAPRYVIEYSRFVPDDLTVGYGYTVSGTDFYKITARATGGTNQAVIILQSTYGKRF